MDSLWLYPKHMAAFVLIPKKSKRSGSSSRTKRKPNRPILNRKTIVNTRNRSSLNPTLSKAPTQLPNNAEMATSTTKNPKNIVEIPSTSLESESPIEFISFVPSSSSASTTYSVPAHLQEPIQIPIIEPIRVPTPIQSPRPSSASPRPSSTQSLPSSTRPQPTQTVQRPVTSRIPRSIATQIARPIAAQTIAQRPTAQGPRLSNRRSPINEAIMERVRIREATNSRIRLEEVNLNQRWSQEIQDEVYYRQNSYGREYRGVAAILHHNMPYRDNRGRQPDLLPQGLNEGEINYNVDPNDIPPADIVGGNLNDEHTRYIEQGLRLYGSSWVTIWRGYKVFKKFSSSQVKTRARTIANQMRRSGRTSLEEMGIFYYIK